MSFETITLHKIPDSYIPSVLKTNVDYNAMSIPGLEMPYFTVQRILDLYTHAKWRYDIEKKTSNGKALGVLQSIGKDKNLPDYSDMIDEWLARKEKNLDEKMAKYRYYDTEPRIVMSMIEFCDEVKTGAPMDIKDPQNWANAFGEDVPYPYTQDQWFTYHGQVMDAATLGNVTYAYVGAKYFSEFALLSGGAFVQTKRRKITDLLFMYGLPNSGEMPEDVEAIKLGIKWREEGFPDEK